MRRLPVALAALLTLTLAAALAAAGLSSTPSAQAQQTEEVVFVDNFGVDPDAIGIATMTAPADWDVTGTCNGAYPLSGDSAPAQVENRKPAPNVLVLKIRNRFGDPLGSPVRVNCTLDIVAPATTTATQARQTLQRVAAQQVALGR
jgi:hypothetical protein